MQLHEFSSPPIIIGGCGRSGTTLLLAILGAHPHIYAIPEETQIFCPGAYDYPEQPSVLDESAQHRERKREDIFKLRMQSLDTTRAISLVQIETYLKASPATATRWCEKTPKNVLFLGQILDLFKDKVRLIHIVRDGRDVVTSIHPGRQFFHVPVQQWITEVRAGLAYQYSDYVYTLRYEDLLQDFEGQIKKLCAFLEEEVTPELLKWHSHTTILSHDSFHTGKVQPLYTDGVGRWKDEQYAHVINELMNNQEAVSLLQQLGYSIS